MRNLAIAYGNNRQSKTWVNKTITFDELKERLKVTIRTPESAEEYAKFNKAKRDAVKDHGGFVAGALKGGRRKVDTVELRSMVALDGDRIDKAFLENYETNAPYTSLLYTTHSSTDDDPRVRLVYPLTRDVTPEEFVAVSRYLAQMLGIDYFDECSYLPNQLMYWPSTPSNGSFVFLDVEKEWLDPDDVLAAHPEWTDPTRLPTSSRESRANTTASVKAQDPLDKEGAVGFFNRAFFPIGRAIEKYLSDVYEPTDNENRWHYIRSSSMAGVEIIEGGKFVYSHHAKDPAYLKLCNAFDLVRIHKFGDDDVKKSFNAMCELAMQDDEVKRIAMEEKLSQAETDFNVSNGDWMTRLKYQPRSGQLENSVYNLNLILANDPDFRSFAYNEMANRIQVTGPLPWERPEGNQFWRDADTAQLMLNLHATFTKGTVEFRLFQFDKPANGKQNGLHAGQLKSYIQLCLALSQMAKEVRTASPKPQQSENPKYAMRTWLLRLGFIGDEFKTARETLTKRLAGDTAFRNGRAA